METEGHPTQDLVDELKRRGAALFPGSSGGPGPESLVLAAGRAEDLPGFWLFVPVTAWETEIDEPPKL